MGEIRWTPGAAQDLEDIAAFIGEQVGRPAAARRLMEQVHATIELLSRGSQMGSARHDLGPGFRLFTVKRYVIVFRKLDDGIQVIRIIDGSRDFSRLFS